MTTPAYSDRFYENRSNGSAASARSVVGCLDSLGLQTPRRVVDVGCGRGHWLEACRERGATDLLGLDGPWNRDHFQSDSTITFRAIDLSAASVSLLESASPGERFDLGISVEALEHLPEAAAEAVIDYLTSSCDLILFSAAIPGQGGTGHRTERWQSHWAGRFAERDFKPFDLVRPMVWADPSVDFWYRQNIVLYSRSDTLAGHHPSDLPMLDLVHPAQFTHRITTPLSARQLLGALRGSIAAGARRGVAKARRSQTQ